MDKDNSQLLTAGRAGLYIHIPFCRQKCPYCDFYSITDLSLVPPFIDALKKEMFLTCGHPLRFDSVYIGGGTPSVLGPDGIAEILTSAHQNFQIIPDCEITVEINPGTIDAADLTDYKQSGINRVNIGVQSFCDQNLEFLGRTHSAKVAADTVKNTQKAGVQNFGLDFIYGIPGQAQSNWRKDLSKAVSFEPRHIACYMLTYEQGTPLAKRRQEGVFQPVAEAQVADLFTFTVEFLASHGYQQYEVSNFAVSKNSRSRHNQKYWSFAPYIGLGPSAHSFVEPLRFWNHSEVITYITELNAGREAIAGKETLTQEQLMIEAIYLGLRQTEGIDLAGFEAKFKIPFIDQFQEEIKRFEEKGYLRVTDQQCALSSKGMCFLDSIAAAFTSKQLI
ncbi:MAG: radical SAM family heme chaperone HemW [Desulfobacterales bacterium]